MDRRTDAVELLTAQHTRIRELFDEVVRTGGDERGRAFHDLVRLLTVHETVEEEVVHPFARGAVEGGERVVADRVLEEERAGRALARLDGMDPDAPEFLDLVAALRQDVLAHADNEERYEFAHFDRVADRGRLEELARAVRAAEALAPTRPHPGTDAAARDVAAASVPTVIDRTREAVRKAMG
ncbi:hemerythrin domain-containing protein [Streptomyces sp. NPDC051315]|uniref:hemerythrin domain-containing protein n=1 Tax=Streptomyces sp. NPDC051315 TaxID=3365650 RepID=UPI00379B2ED9